MTSPNLTFITDQKQILKCLTESLHRGNVVGVTSEAAGHTLFLTAVENIYESGVTREKMISFKKFDIHGVNHERHCIPLKQIDRVQSFQTLYKDSLRKTFRKIVSDNEANTKIRQLETQIPPHDLKVILIKLLDTHQRVRIIMPGRGNEPIDGFVKEIDQRFEKIVINAGASGQIKKDIKISQIESIEFDNYFTYKSCSSKIFRVQDYALKLSKAQ